MRGRHEDCEVATKTARPIETLGRERAIRVDGYRLAGPFPETHTLQPYQDTSPVGQVVAAAVARRGGEASTSENMRCAARELGLFMLEHGALPATGLRRFILATCQVLAEPPAVATFAAGGEPEGDEWMTRASKAMQANVENMLAGHRVEIGVWSGRRDDRVVVVSVSGERLVTLAPMAIVPDASNHVYVQGTLHTPAEHVLGLMNQGLFGVTECWTDPRVPSPNFALTCPIAPDDPVAWLQVLAQSKDHLLADTLLRVLVKRPGGDLDYRAPNQLGSQPVSHAGEFRAVLSQQVNAVRARAGLAPLRLLDAQSAVADRVAPHFFAGREGEDLRLTQDRVALGLLAGWDAGGTIRAGDFVAVMSPTADAGFWLSDVLEQPIGRKMLLDPEAQGIASGVVMDGSAPVLGSVMTTYSFFEGFDHTAAATRLLARLQSYRAWSRQSPAQLVAIPGFAETCSEVMAGSTSERDALTRLGKAVGRTLRQPVSAYVVESLVLDSIQFPPDLLAPVPPYVGIGVCHRKFDDLPWGHYVVFFIYTSAPQGGGYASTGEQTKL